MQRSIVLVCFALLGLALLIRATPAVAQTEIHRCIGANGGAVFTDQPCAALQATPVRPAGAARPSPSPAATPLPTLCAASVGELRQSVIDAFAARDANRLAGLILWDGYGRGAAIADIRALAALMKQPLLGVDAPHASSTPANAGSDDPFLPPAPVQPPPADQLVLRTADDDADGNATAWHFDIVRDAGCLWLRNAN